MFLFLRQNIIRSNKMEYVEKPDKFMDNQHSKNQ